jgi:hypothetical protein
MKQWLAAIAGTSKVLWLVNPKPAQAHSLDMGIQRSYTSMHVCVLSHATHPFPKQLGPRDAQSPVWWIA